MTYNPGIVLENPGIIDTAAIKTFGVNVKETDNPIGYFGTGLKYAIAILLRHSHKVTIYAGEQPLNFYATKIHVRGKEFSIVNMNEEELGFTLDLGKSWAFWTCFRELYSNMLDEGGRAFFVNDVNEVKGTPNTTRIVICGEEFSLIYQERHKYFLAERKLEPLFTCRYGEMYPGCGSDVFYRGINVGKLNNDTAFVYNITGAYLSLTEDRTVGNSYYLYDAIKKIVISCNDPDMVSYALNFKKGFEREKLDYGDSLDGVSTEFLKVATDIYMNRPESLSHTLKSALKSSQKLPDTYIATPLSKTEHQALNKAIRVCKQLGYEVDTYDIVVVDCLGEGIMGLAKSMTIYVSLDAFDWGLKLVVNTLIEEYIHLKYNFNDCSREMQNFLFNKLMSLYEEHVLGEPL